MQTAEEKKISALNDLIIINNDRSEGYRTAADETNDLDLKELFLRYSRQSDSFNGELRAMIADHHDEPDHDETTASGKLYRVWMDVKSALAANDRHAVLSSCEFGEDVALGTYKDALDEELSSEVKSVILRQKQEIQDAHDHIRTMRDAEK